MAAVLELREHILNFYRARKRLLDIIIKFILAFFTFLIININIGYMSRLDNVFLIIVLSVICAFLPMNVTLLVAAVLVVVHLYALSIVAALMAAVIFIIALLLYFGFSPKHGWKVLYTPVLYTIKLPYIMPLSAGVTASPISLIPICIGIVIYYYLSGIKASAPLYRQASEDSFEMLLTTVKLIFANPRLFAEIAVVIVTMVIVMAIGKLSFNHSKSAAIAAGAVLNLVANLLICVYFNDTSGVPAVIIGEAVCTVVAYIVQFMLITMDYSRAEYVQFEDDEYYYYVKAIPKSSVSIERKLVKHYNKPEKEERE